jgi:transposase
MQALLDCCCGVDIHRDVLEACILKGDSDTPKIIRKQFKTTQGELLHLVSWLNEHSCFHVAMESTAVYWRPVYETIEKHYTACSHLVVVNARHMRNLPGRKTDVKDAEWIATLLRHGLLEASFVPDRVIRTLREYSRTYKAEVQEKSRLLNRIEKFLQNHGFKLSSVLSNIVGVSGRNLLQQLVEKGSLSPEDIRRVISKRIKRSVEDIQAAACGELEEYERKLLHHLIQKLDTCEAGIANLLTEMADLAAPYHSVLEAMDSIPGIDLTSALTILAEIGPTPMKSFKTPEHLSSWAGLAPRNDESAGKIKSKKVLHGNPYIKSILCQVAWAATRSRHSAFARWFWSHQGKLGKKKAIIAVSRKILSLIYVLIQRGELYNPDYQPSSPRKCLALS